MQPIFSDSPWDKIVGLAPPASAPEPPFKRFLVDCYSDVKELESREPVDRGDLMFLDIGSGKDRRHSQAIAEFGAGVISVDISHYAPANVHGDIFHMSFPPAAFHGILDIKTLCASEDTSIYERIYEWLVPGGYFYSMCPTDRHLKEKGGWDITQGLPFMRRASKEEIQDMLHMFSNLNIRELYEPISRKEWLSTWCIEAKR